MLTRDANISMMDRILLRPRVLRNVSQVNTKTKILGCQTGLPLFVSPAAMAKMVHPEGELAMARGCARYGVGQCVSSLSFFLLWLVSDWVPRYLQMPPTPWLIS